ncbi:hypothetical protein BZM26_34905 [Paraburkholderia strydomiana]|nr:hypothetical protein BZM26_34905 [Paraburkholderia strydomiana]
MCAFQPLQRYGMCSVHVYRLAVAAFLFLVTGLQAQADTENARTPSPLCSRHENDWTLTERHLWQQLCMTGVASGNDAPVPLPAELKYQKISASFIKTLLTGSPYRERVAKTGLQLKAISIADSLDLRYKKLPANIEIIDFSAKDLFMAFAQLEGSLILSNGDVGELELLHTHVSGNLYLQRIQFGHVSPCGSYGDKTVVAPYSQVDGKVSIIDTRAAGFFLENSQFSKGLDVLATNTISLDLSQTRLTGMLKLDGDALGWPPSCNPQENGSPIMTPLAMDGLTASSDVMLTANDIRGPVAMPRVVVDGSLIASKTTFASNLDLSEAKIGRRLDLEPSDLNPWSSHSELSLRDATVGTLVASDPDKAWPPRLDLHDFNFVNVLEKIRLRLRPTSR